MDRLPELSTIDITLLVPEGTKMISSYSENSVYVNDDKFENSIVISELSVKEFNDSKDFINSLDDDLNLIVIYGRNNLGKKTNFKNLSKLSTLRNVVFEVMNLGSACRTYNILITEGRKVIAVIDF